MDNTISTDQTSQTNNESTSFDLSLLKENPQVQQLLLMALSAAKQQNEQTQTDNDKRKYDQLDALSISSELATLSDHGSPGSDSNSDKMHGRPGRKPLAEDEVKMSEMDPKSKRKAQNRAAQRAFRERRVNYVKELEDKIKLLEKNQGDKILEENRQLKKMIQQLQVENAILGGTASSFDLPLSKLSSNNHERPQKLLRSIDDTTLLSATTVGDRSPDANDHYSSSSPSLSSKSRSLTPPETMTTTTTTNYDDDIDQVLFSSTMPTDILTSFDPFSLEEDPGFFNTLPKPTTDESNALMESLLVTDEEDLSQQQQQPPLEILTKTWDKITEHPRFDEFDIDILCDEMKRKAACSNMNDHKTHDEHMKESIEKYYPSLK